MRIIIVEVFKRRKKNSDRMFKRLKGHFSSIFFFKDVYIPFYAFYHILI